jgi:hypothetical protein
VTLKSRIPFFDIFRGRFLEADAEWIDSIEGLGAARERMKKIAAEKPGPYFVFGPQYGIVFAAIDATPVKRGLDRIEDPSAA